MSTQKKQPMYVINDPEQLEVKMNNPLCPILLIGFNPPEKGQRDLRRCTDECALYDEEREQCSIKSCCEILADIPDTIVDISQGYYAFGEDENFEFDANTYKTN